VVGHLVGLLMVLTSIVIVGFFSHQGP
jgi:hypothetical protein